MGSDEELYYECLTKAKKISEKAEEQLGLILSPGDTKDIATSLFIQEQLTRKKKQYS